MNTLERLIEINRVKTLNLIPSENILSDNAKKVMTLDLANRYHLPTDYPNTKPMPSRKELHSYLMDINNKINKFYGTAWCDCRALSGTHMMMIIMGSFRHKVGNFLSLSKTLGGHSVTSKLAESFLYKTAKIPGEKTKINFKKLKKNIEKAPPTLIYLDHSNLLELIDVQKILKIMKPNDILFYDISHPNIFWTKSGIKTKDKRFIFGGTVHKSFPGPQKAILLSYVDSQTVADIKEYLKYAVSSPHLAELFALDITIDEMRKYGKRYREQILRNANRLARELSKKFIVAKTTKKLFTKTHQVWVKCEDVEKFTEDCASAKISIYRNYIPAYNELGLRIGVQEITRMGLKERDMDLVANALIYIKKNEIEKAKTIIDKLLQKMSRPKYA